MVYQDLDKWLNSTPLGRYLQNQEFDFIQLNLNNEQPETVLRVGLNVGDFRLPEKCACWSQNVVLPADVLAEHQRTPWQMQTFDCVVAAHTLDCVDAPELWLAEMWRIVKPNGRLILTGFNRHSWWRLGALDISGCLSLAESKKLMESMGWQIERGRFMNYLPPINSQMVVDKLGFLELVGNRWLPHGAAVYGLVLRKDVVGIHPLGEAEWVELDEAAVLALAKQAYSGSLK